MGPSQKLTGWRYTAFLGGFFGLLVLALYPIGIRPFLDPEPFKKIQRGTRKGISQEDIQPGNMRVWSDPFKPLTKGGESKD